MRTQLCMHRALDRRFQGDAGGGLPALTFRPDRSHHVRGLGMMKAAMSGPSRPSRGLTLALPTMMILEPNDLWVGGRWGGAALACLEV